MEQQGWVLVPLQLIRSWPYNDDENDGENDDDDDDVDGHDNGSDVQAMMMTNDDNFVHWQRPLTGHSMKVFHINPQVFN